jgi:hypothetical protein
MEGTVCVFKWTGTMIRHFQESRTTSTGAALRQGPAVLMQAGKNEQLG